MAGVGEGAGSVRSVSDSARPGSHKDPPRVRFMAPEPSGRACLQRPLEKPEEPVAGTLGPHRPPPSLTEDLVGGERGCLSVLACLAVPGTSPLEWGPPEAREDMGDRISRSGPPSVRAADPLLLPPAAPPRPPVPTGGRLFPAGQRSSPCAGGSACHHVSQARRCQDEGRPHACPCASEWHPPLSRSWDPGIPSALGAPHPHSTPSALHPPVSPNFPRGGPLCAR